MLGHVALSRDSRGIGTPLLHNLACTSDDPYDAARLCFKARKFLRNQGINAFLIHHTPGAPEKIVNFWIRCGANLEATIYRVQC